MATKLQALIVHHTEQKKQVTREIVEDFYRYKPMEFRQPPPQALTTEEEALYRALDGLQILHVTKYHQIVTTMEHAAVIAASLEGTLCKNLLLQAGETFYLYVSDMELKAIYRN